MKFGKVLYFSQFQKFKETFVVGCVAKNLHRGMEEGLYRSNLNPEIIASIYSWKMDLFFDPMFTKQTGQTNFVDVYLEYIRYHIRGIASEKGRTYLKQTLIKEDLNLF